MSDTILLTDFIPFPSTANNECLGRLQIMWTAELGQGTVSRSAFCTSLPIEPNSLLSALSCITRYEQSINSLGMGCGPDFWNARSAVRWRSQRQLSHLMGQKKALHDWRSNSHDHCRHALCLGKEN